MKINSYIYLKKIVIFVFATHLILLLLFLLPKKLQKKKQRIVVREKIYPIKPPKKSIVKKKTFSKPNQNKAKQKSRIQNQSLIHELEKSFSVLSEKEPAIQKKIVIPNKIQLKIDQKNPEIDSPHLYESELIQFLQNRLRFENHGDVTLEMTIQATGKLLRFKTLESKNVQNESYLKNRLPELDFPCFNTYNISENELTFVVKFCNN